MVVSQEEDNQDKENQLIIRNIMSSLESRKMLHLIKLKKHIERRPSGCIQIKVEIQNNSRNSPKLMRSLAIRIRENSTTKVV